jgi:hypothetical protein
MAVRHMRAMINSVITTQPILRPAVNGFAQMNRSRSSRLVGPLGSRDKKASSGDAKFFTNTESRDPLD